MPPEALRPETPAGWTGPSASADGRLVQERLRLFGGLAFLISAVFYGVGQVLVQLGRDNPPTPAGHAALFAILLLMGGTWLYCRRVTRPEGALRALDALLMLGLGTLVLIVPSRSRRVRPALAAPRCPSPRRTMRRRLEVRPAAQRA